MRIDFRANTQRVAPRLRAATQKATQTTVVNRAKAIEALGEEYWQSLRQAAHDLRLHAITHLDEYVPQLERQVTYAGGKVYRARDAAEVRHLVLLIARRHNAKRVVKVKSMLTEEIELNHALQAAGMQVFETDLGEYIVQLDGTRPSHPTAPAVHLTKEDIAALFRKHLNVDAPPDPQALTEIARVKLRQEFLSADLGISGGNFLVAETGTLVIVTNEGNGRMCTTLPPVHIAVVGIEKIVPDWKSMAILLQLLARSTTGQKLTAYTTFITGIWEGGPREFHLVLVDNGRTRILQDEQARETLLCIRCGACANICPVYNNVSGHAYGWVYTGPIGAIVTPQLIGTQAARDLPFASTLCGACNDVCPVKIPFTSILLHLRHRVIEGDHIEKPAASPVLRAGARVGVLALGTPWLYQFGSQLLKVLQAPLRRGDWLPALPPPLNRWTLARPFPAFRAGFREWWKHKGGRMKAEGEKDFSSFTPALACGASVPHPSSFPKAPPVTRHTPPVTYHTALAEIDKLGGQTHWIHSRDDLEAAFAELVANEKIGKATLWQTRELQEVGAAETLARLGVKIVSSDAGKRALAECDLGVTGADAVLAETGTLVLRTSAEQAASVSLLPRVHLAIFHPAALRADLRDAFAQVKNDRHVSLITGPSRTTDIEKVLAIGVHGPKRLYVWCYDERTS